MGRKEMTAHPSPLCLGEATASFPTLVPPPGSPKLLQVGFASPLGSYLVINHVATFYCLLFSCVYFQLGAVGLGSKENDPSHNAFSYNRPLAAFPGFSKGILEA